MSTLLLRLSGPMQAWGNDSKFEVRRTEREPSKSGVIGLLAAALGRKRNESLDDLNSLYFGVRVDKEGELLRDFQTARTIKDKTYITYRDYLVDATFLVGLESENEEFLKEIENAIKSPAFPLFLGRRSCIPSLPIALGIRSSGLIEALKYEPWILTHYMQEKQKRKGLISLRITTDAKPYEQWTARERDLPVTFNPMNRVYAYRILKEREPVIISDIVKETSHDVMSEL